MRNNQNFMQESPKKQNRNEFKTPTNKDKHMRHATFGDSSILKLPRTKNSQPTKNRISKK